MIATKETNVDYIGLRDACIEKARKAERTANERTTQISSNAAKSLRRRNPNWEKLPFSERQARIKDLMIEWRKTDAVWKSAIADNQWYIQQAIMYGTAANGDILLRIAQATSHLVPDGVSSMYGPGYRQS